MAQPDEDEVAAKAEAKAARAEAKAVAKAKAEARGAKAKAAEAEAEALRLGRIESDKQQVIDDAKREEAAAYAADLAHDYAVTVFTPTRETQVRARTLLDEALNTLTQRERDARQTLETANADPEATLHGNYKLREIYDRTHPPDSHTGPDTPLRRGVLATLLEQFMPRPRPSIEGILTPDELDARTTLSKAREDMRSVRSGNAKILDFNQRVANRPTAARTFGSGFVGW
jgi:hypothetical protein